MGNRRLRPVHRLLLNWYRKNGRSLPWRNTRDPYRILLSEVMLQQTQVSRVLIKYPGFLLRFPDLTALARSPRRDVIRAWSGMGYNNRAVRLHALAQEVVASHGGAVPADYGSLISLPGIGRYTANAVLSSAFRKRVAIVDTNVWRVLSRITLRQSTVSDRLAVNAVWEKAAALLPSQRVHDWNQALMDLGATVCLGAAPRCDTCPLSSVCASAGRLGPSKPRRERREPSFRGTPNRIYRGRIVEILRQRRPGSGIPMARLGRMLHDDFSDTHNAWLSRLLGALERDGIVRVTGRNPLPGRRVHLA